VITETAQTYLTEIRRQVHTDCFVCSRENEQGLHLKFHAVDDGEVKADFIFKEDFEGYPGMLHGGIISTVLDGAMTNCLFAQGCTAVTADFRVRFRHQVITGQMAGVRAWITRSTPPIYELKAEIIQDGQVKTTAMGKFMEQSQLHRKLNP
jgi:acyl-coenzyme A thioesterase PaaI-like protein